MWILLALPRQLQVKIEHIYPFGEKKNKQTKKKHGNLFKNWPCPNFSCCPKNLSCPAAPTPRPVRRCGLRWVVFRSALLRYSSSLFFDRHYNHCTKEIILPLISKEKFSSNLIKIRDLYWSRKLTGGFSRKIIFKQHPRFVLRKRHLRAHLLKS